MSGEPAARRLAAILMADAVGYSRLMGQDEEDTVRQIKAAREVFASRIGGHRGRLVNAPGDSILAEFGSVVNAVRAAFDIQAELTEAGADLPEDRRMAFRIGINLGDVISEADAVYGDGVNIAARLESLAEAGGLCLSRAAYDQVKGKIEQDFEYIGEHAVKNIAEPVRVYRSAREGSANSPVDAPGSPDSATSAAPSTDPFQDRASIAVLPFANMSGDPEQEYFADGITEDIITELSRLRNLKVIARNSVFVYKGKPADVRQICQDLAVGHVLEGSVRKSGNRVRITAQLIDGASGDHLWAERYDRELKDVFDLQDEITKRIVTELDVKLVEGEAARKWRASTNDPEAYDHYLRGLRAFDSLSRNSLLEAKLAFEKALEIDPDFTAALSWLGWMHFHAVIGGWSKDSGEELLRAEELARRAIQLDDGLPEPHTLLGGLLIRTDVDAAMRELDVGVSLGPNNSSCLVLYGMYSAMLGQTRKSLALLEKSVALNPNPPDWYLQPLGYGYLHAGRIDQAIETLERCAERLPEYVAGRMGLLAAYAIAGRDADAVSQANQIAQISPNFQLIHLRKAVPAEYWDRVSQLARDGGLS